MKRYLDRIFIIAGIIIIICAVAMKVQTSSKEKKLIEEYKIRMETLNNNEEDETESESKINNNEEDETQNESKINNNDNISVDVEEGKNTIGIIEIPKIELTALIGEGTDNETLKYSVGHFEKTAMPGEKGNCCIIGHRSYTYGEYFNRLDEIKKDDYITIQYNNKTYNYVVSDIFEVEPNEISVLENNKNNDSEITLITCTPLRIGTHRLIIKGKLK